MKIMEIKEQNDGSAELKVDITKEEINFLIEFAFNRLLEDYIKNQDFSEGENNE